jgi:hypothetical protein
VDDARDHPLRAVLPPSPAVPPAPVRHRPWQAQPSLDQGATGTCVGHGARHWLQTAPVVDKPAVGPDAYDLYRQAVLVDEFPENDGEATKPNAQLQYGTSVRAVMKVLQARGYLKEYVRAYSAAEVGLAVKSLTPVLIGTNWTRGMFLPTVEGVVRYEGPVIGGHCTLVHWLDERRGLFLLQQNWGWAWGVDHPTQASLRGKRGFFYVPGEDFERLLADDAEAWTAVEVRRRHRLLPPLPGADRDGATGTPRVPMEVDR